jgi:hypothetical protein
MGDDKYQHISNRAKKRGNILTISIEYLIIEVCRAFQPMEENEGKLKSFQAEFQE